MVPNCLNEWIGVKCLSQSKSGFWINDLEGLNLKYAADIVDTDHISGLEFLKSKINFSTALVIEEIKGYMMPYYRINSLVDEIVVGDWRKNNYLAPLNADRGVKLTTKKSRLLRIRIQTVKINIQQANYTGSLQVVDGIDTISFPFTTDANGETEVFVNYLSNTNVVYVTTNDATINVNNSAVKSNCNCNTKTTSFLTANGWNGSIPVNTTYGLQVLALAECSMDDVACILSSKLTFPILYRAGMEIAKEAATTDRLNSITLLDSEKVDLLMSSFKAEYDKYFKILVDSLPELMKRVDDCCIVCNQSRYVQGLP